MRHRLLWIALFSTAFLTFSPAASPSLLAQPTSSDGRPDQIVLQPGQHPSIAGAAAGYLSPPTEAAHAFTHLLLRREAHVPDGAALTLFVRASIDGDSWGEWTAALENDDLWADSDGPDVQWSQTFDAGGMARFWQVRGDFAPAPDGTLPALRSVDVNTVDASVTPSPATIAGAQIAGALAKPAVVSRVSWGSPDGESSRVKPAYYPVNHMVVHHTADSNSLLPGESSWAARVRAEWSFHTFSRGWGDVGYNYLIDPNGVIYEGRAGGDDAVAFHDTGNYGSMGVVLIGTYATVPPTQAAQDALVNLLAWKASQKHIDPLASSYYYGCDISSYCRPYNRGAIVPNIAGHRQVTPGHTSCPGDQAMAYLPGIRNRVKQAISAGASGPSDNGDLVIDELETGFSRSPTSWHDAGCGYGGHTDWTYATDAAAENSATWRPTIPSTGTYRVYAHIPQGCGLGTSPYASAQARYNIAYAGGSTSRVVDQNAGSEWADLGAYQFNQGDDGAVELFDNTGEPVGASKVLFFDAVKWVPEDAAATNIQLKSVAYDRTTLASGELLKVTFTVKNTGSTTIYSQAPRVDLTAGGGLNSDNNGYVYDQDECFNGNESGSYPAYPKESDRFRVTLGVPGWDSDHTTTCVGATGDNPWRWGLNSNLAPGATQTVVGYVRFRVPGTYALQSSLIQEYVQYYAQGVSPATITVTPENVAPDAATYDSQLQPLARVYTLGSLPDNFLTRTRNPLSIPRGQYIGSFAWDGRTTAWGAGGPLGQTDHFLIEQTRVFIAPISGLYTFRTTNDDGAWLWVDGQPVIVNNGLHDAADLALASTSINVLSDAAAVDGQISLAAGSHTLAFKYFDRTGDATAGYNVQMPGETFFRGVIDGLGGSAPRFGGTFAANPTLALAADDEGGTGVDHIHWSWDGVSWQDSPGALLSLGKLANGSYHLRYQAIDSAGNQGDQRDLVFTVNTGMRVYRMFVPVVL